MSFVVTNNHPRGKTKSVLVVTLCVRKVNAKEPGCSSNSTQGLAQSFNNGVPRPPLSVSKPRDACSKRIAQN
ncbi:hypothetical protein NC651_019942 [Populus alba x Populus x berolinensis]|nr:hypothetical protein NC651_019942 [Populus alba x Populus x berolinensis]